MAGSFSYVLGRDGRRPDSQGERESALRRWMNHHHLFETRWGVVEHKILALVSSLPTFFLDVPRRYRTSE